MNTLIVEDDTNKLVQIETFLLGICPKMRIEFKRSYQGGLRAIINKYFDLVVLDMSLPTFDINAKEEGGPFLTFAGEEILSEMDRRSIHSDVIIVTQFDNFGEGADKITLSQLKERLSLKFKHNYLKTIFYEASEKNWKDEIASIIKCEL